MTTTQNTSSTRSHVLPNPRILLCDPEEVIIYSKSHFKQHEGAADDDNVQVQKNTFKLETQNAI